MSPRTCGTQPDWGAPVRPPSSRRWAVGLVALLLVGLLGLSAWWIAEDQYPNGYEVCEHLLYTRRMANELAGGADLGQWLADNRRIGGRTTLMHLSMASLMVRLPGDGNRMITLLSTSLSLAVLAASCFLLAEQIGETPWAGALAGALVLLLPPIWGFSRRYGTDLPLTAGVALFALVLLRCSPWQSWRRALSVGLLAGTICLIKNAFLLWLGALLLPALLLAFDDTRISKSQIFRQTAWLTLGFGITTACFWFGEWTTLTQYIQFHVAQGNPHSALDERWTWRWATFYLGGSWDWIGRPLNFALAAGILWSLFKTDRRSGLLWSWWLLGTLIFTLVGTKWMRYYLPALPAICVLAAVGFAQMQRRLSAPLSVGALLVAGWVCLSASIGAAPSWNTLDSELCTPPIKSTWREVAHGIGQRSGAVRPRVIGLIGPDVWDGDDYSRLELFLLEFFPLTEVQRASAGRLQQEARAFESSRRRIELWIEIRVPENPVTSTPPPGEWITLGHWSLKPAVQPLPGRPLDEPLDVFVQIRQELLTGD